MCGISGYINRNRRHSQEALTGNVRRMSMALTRRGPDDQGAWADGAAGIALGHSRLSIIDLSQEGHQPMFSACGRYAVSYNGEFFNYASVRAELEASYPFRSHCDTEVLLAGVSRWGLEATLQKMVGMFAFALWDRELQTLHLVRDRLGIKPVYYGWSGENFLFGSELKALKAHPDFKAEVNRDALNALLRFGYVPAPLSIYSGIRKLKPGCILTLRLKAPEEPAVSRFWSALEAAREGIARPFEASEGETARELEKRLHECIGLRMVSDVPIGAFLSGGIDSSTVVAIMQAQNPTPVKTFTIGFRQEEYNEADHARKVAAHLGTDHTELILTPKDALDAIPLMPQLYDEPFADPSQIPTYLVSKLARTQVTVALSGDGGDELFGGYNRYLWARRIWGVAGRAPHPLRRLMARMVTGVPPESWSRLARLSSPLIPKKLNFPQAGDKIHKVAELLPAESRQDLYLKLVSLWKDPESAVIGASGGDPPRFAPPGFADYTQEMMYSDLVTYLPDDILVKVDRASMGVSLEARVPLLDHRLVEFAWRIPLAHKIKGAQGKWILRQVLYRHVPKELVERPKMGFGVPIGDWLRGPLKDWADNLLDEARLKREGYLDPAPVRRKFSEHLSGQRNWQYPLWPVLMFQAWLEQHS